MKSKQYDKALRALELLDALDPTSTKTPTVRILEGNLRIRKAQMIRQAQINGTISHERDSDAGHRVRQGRAIFAETHDAFVPSYAALSQHGRRQPSIPPQFLDQIARPQHARVPRRAPIPEAAAQWLRDEPEVQRVVGVEMRSRRRSSRNIDEARR